MTFKEMYEEVQKYLGDRADYLAADAKEDVNRQYRKLAMSYQFHELEFTDTSIVTTSGTAQYPEPTGTRTIVGMRDVTNDNELFPKDMDWYKAQPQDSVKGVPTNFVRWEDGQFFLYPTPDGQYSITVYYKKLPDEMVNDADEPVYPEDWHETIVLLAASRALFRYSLDARAMNIKNEALSDVASQQEEHTMDRRKRIGQVKVERQRVG